LTPRLAAWQFSAWSTKGDEIEGSLAMARLMNRRRAVALAAVALATPAARARAQSLPSTVTIVSGFAAGGSQDLLARLLAEEFRATLGANFIVENRTGASGTLAAKAVRASEPNGGMVLIANIVAMSLAPFSFPNLGYDPVADFAAIGKTTEFQIALGTGPATGATTFPALMEWAKANPGKANLGIPGAGSLPHLYAVRLAELSGVAITTVAYRGGAPIVQDLAAGQLQMGMGAPADFLELHRGKKMTIVAASGTERHPAMADVPTWSEMGVKGLESNGWNGLFLAPGTPEPIVRRYAEAMRAALAKPEVKKRLEEMGFLVTPTDGDAMRRQIAEEMRVWGPVMTKALAGR
jgi:tripartite-type tricarboxylate transporter receptor subunit TctC